MYLITLQAERKGSSVIISNTKGQHKATFTNNGYRPTKATKTIVLNCWKFKLNWKS